MVQAGVYAILLTQTLNAVATMAVLPSLPFFALQIGATAFDIALLETCYNLSTFFCSPVLGVWSDKVGRKRVMLMGLMLASFLNTFQGWATTPTGLMLARAAVGVALSTGPVEMAYIMDSTNSEEELSKVLALQRIVCNAGALSGPLVAKFFSNYGFPVLCRILSMVNLLNVCIGIMFWQEGQSRQVVVRTPLEEAQPPTETSKSLPWAEIFRNPATGSLLALSFLYTFGCGVSDGPEVVFLKEHYHYGQSEVCTFIMATCAASLAVAPLMPDLIRVIGEVNACLVGCLGSCVVVLSMVMGLRLSWMPYFYGATSVGLFGSMVGMSYMGLVHKMCPANRVGMLLGLKSSMDGLAGTLAPAIGGMVYAYDHFWAYGLTAGFSAVAAGLCGFMLPLAAQPGEMKPLVPTRMKRSPSLPDLGMPVYFSKHFTVQMLTNQLRITMDPELKHIYDTYKSSLSRTKGQQMVHGMRPAASVPDDMVAADMMRMMQHDSAMASTAPRSVSLGNFHHDGSRQHTLTHKDTVEEMDEEDEELAFPH